MVVITAPGGADHCQHCQATLVHAAGSRFPVTRQRLFFLATGDLPTPLTARPFGIECSRVLVALVPFINHRAVCGEQTG